MNTQIALCYIHHNEMGIPKTRALLLDVSDQSEFPVVPNSTLPPLANGLVFPLPVPQHPSGEPSCAKTSAAKESSLQFTLHFPVFLFIYFIYLNLVFFL